MQSPEQYFLGWGGHWQPSAGSANVLNYCLLDRT